MAAQDPSPEASRTLSILKDDPLFWSSIAFDPQEDAFNHEAYAHALYKLLADNAPPLTIGLFGSWGIGKSTIIGILKGFLAQSQATRLRFVYFNAWKYSGDSFRRQFLIEAAKQILAGTSDVEATVKRIERLNYTDVLRDTPSQSLTALLKDLLSLRVTVKQSFLVRLVLAVLVLMIGGVVSATTHSLGPILTAIVPALLLFLLKAKFEDVFVIQENPIYDPKLIFPEQFESTFEDLLSRAKMLNDEHVVVVIDDVDRCDPGVVKDILISIKTFLGNKKCFFLVPCDEDVVVEAFQASGPTQRYRDELLRKYFNVGIRIAPLMGSDLIDFANKVARTTDIPEMVIQLAVLTNCRDARKMKQFLNTFRVKYEIAKTREQNKYFPLDVDQHVDALAKAILLEDVDPGLMDILLQNPDAYSVLERAASDSSADTDLKKYGLEKWREKYPNLERILRRTRDIKFKDVEVFLTLKTANPETRLPRGYELKELMLAGDLGKLLTALADLKSSDHKENLVSVLIDALQHSRALFLKNILSAALEIYSVPDYLASADRKRLEVEIGYSLRLNRGLKVLDFDIGKLLLCAKQGGFLEECYKRTLDEVVNREGIAPPPSVVESLFQLSENRASLAWQINQVAAKWITTESGLQMVSQYTIRDVKEDERIPSTSIIRTVISGLSFGSGEESKLNPARQQLVISHWDPQFTNELLSKMLTGFQALQNQSAFDNNVDVLLNLMLALPDVVSNPDATALWSHVSTWYSKTSQNPGRWKLYQSALLFAASSADESVRRAALTLVQQAWNGSIKNTIIPTLLFLKAHPAHFSIDTQKALAAHLVSSVRAQLASPDDRTAETLTLLQENRDLLADSGTVAQLLIEGLSAGAGAALEWWKAAVQKHAAIQDADFRATILESTMKGLESAGSDRAKLQVLSEVFISFYEGAGEGTKYTHLGRFFELCKHTNEEVRKIALSHLKALQSASNPHQFKLGLNKLVGDICYGPESQIMSLRDSLNTALEFNDLFTAYEWREIAHACKRLLQSSDTGQRDYALFLLSQFTKMPPELEQDLVVLCINISREASSSAAIVARQVLEKLMPLDGMGEESRKLIMDFLRVGSNESDAKSEKPDTVQ